MPMPDIFTEGDPVEAKLAGYFEEMYEYLLDSNVPEDRLPGPWHMLSRMVKCIDPDLFREWLDAYVAIEAEEDDEDEDEDSEENRNLQPRPKPRRRPDYLRAIDPVDPSEEDVQEEATLTDGS